MTVASTYTRETRQVSPPTVSPCHSIAMVDRRPRSPRGARLGVMAPGLAVRGSPSRHPGRRSIRVASHIGSRATSCAVQTKASKGSTDVAISRVFGTRCHWCVRRRPGVATRTSGRSLDADAPPPTGGPSRDAQRLRAASKQTSCSGVRQAFLGGHRSVPRGCPTPVRLGRANTHIEQAARLPAVARRMMPPHVSVSQRSPTCPRGSRPIAPPTSNHDTRSRVSMSRTSRRSQWSPTGVEQAPKPSTREYPTRSHLPARSPASPPDQASSARRCAMRRVHRPSASTIDANGVTTTHAPPRRVRHARLAACRHLERVEATPARPGTRGPWPHGLLPRSPHRSPDGDGARALFGASANCEGTERDGRNPGCLHPR